MKKITATPHNDGVSKVVNMTLVGVDSNAFAILGKFRKNAIKQNFNSEWIEQVIEKAQDGGYSTLVCTIMDAVTMGAENKVNEPAMVETDECPADYRPAYWCHEGNYEELKEELWDALVPTNGECIDKEGNIIGYAEVFRMINRLGYDLYNNGLCNDRREEIACIVANERNIRPYMDGCETDLDNFIKFCEFYVEKLEGEEQHDGYYHDTCHECDGGGEVYDYDSDEEDAMTSCEECGGSGETLEYDEYNSVDWLDWFTAERMRMLDRVFDGIILYADAERNKVVAL